MRESRTKSNIKVGEKLYVNKHGYGMSNEPNLEEYKITKVNTASIYAETLDTGYTVRFHRKDLTANNGIGIHYRAYLYKNEYWDRIERHKEMDRITELMTHEIKRMSYEELSKLEDSFQLIINLRPSTSSIK